MAILESRLAKRGLRVNFRKINYDRLAAVVIGVFVVAAVTFCVCNAYKVDTDSNNTYAVDCAGE